MADLNVLKLGPVRGKSALQPTLVDLAGLSKLSAFPASGPTFIVSGSQTISNATISGATIVFASGATLTLGTGASLIDCEFDFSRITQQAHVPGSFLAISGSRVTIRGCRSAEGKGLPANFSLFLNDGNFRGRHIDIVADGEDIAIEQNSLDHGYFGIWAVSRNLKNLRIRNNRSINSLHFCIWLDGITGSNHDISENHFPAASFNSPRERVCEIKVVYGVRYYTANGMTNAVYLNNHGREVRICGNVIPQTAHRAIYLVNACGAVISDNVINQEATIGDNVAGQGRSDDVIVLEAVRYFACANNKIYTSGENAIDFLSCKHGTVTGNTLHNIDVTGLMFDIADMIKTGNANYDPVHRLCENITTANNFIEPGVVGIEIRAGRHIKCADTIGKFFGFTPASGTRFDVSINSSMNTAWGISKANNIWLEDLDFSGCRKTRREQVQVASVDVGTGTFSIGSNGGDHGLCTGDRVTAWLENPATGTMPTGLSDTVDYFVVRVDRQTFRLATSFNNAVAGTVLTFTGALSGELYISELQAGRVTVGTSPGSEVRGVRFSRDLAEVSPLMSWSASTSYDHVWSSNSGISRVRDTCDFRFALLLRNAVTDFGSSSALRHGRHYEFAPGYVADRGTQAVTFTSALSGSTSGVLSTAWALPSGSYLLRLDEGSLRFASFTNGSTAVSWTGAVSAGASATVIVDAARGVAIQWQDRDRVKYRTGASLLPTPAASASGAPGTGVATVTSGFGRLVAM